MKTRKQALPRMLMLLIIWPLLSPAVAAKEQGFKAIVKHIESRYRAKRLRIPFLGVAGLAVRIVRPAGVKSFKLAVFEDQDFSRHAADAEFETMLQSALAKGWQPLVRRRSRRDGDGERVYIYSKPAGKDTQLMTVMMESRQAVVLEAKVNPEAMARFLEKPSIMGKSLVGSLRGESPLASLGNRSFDPRRRDGDLTIQVRESSIAHAAAEDASARVDGQPADLGAKSRPALLARKPDGGDPDLQPVSNSERPADAAEVKPKLPDKGVIRLETHLVNLNVKVMDRAGNPVPDLRAEDFVIYENGVEQEIAFFHPVTAPLNLVLLLDLSGSTEKKIKEMKEAAKKFVDSLNPNTRIAVATFTSRFRLVVPFTADRKQLKHLIGQIEHRGGGTEYYQAMEASLDLLREINGARKVIVVLTDGVDNALQHDPDPSAPEFERLFLRVSEEDVTIYPIYFDTETRRGGSVAWLFSRPSSRRGQSYAAARQQLQAVAEQTGGLMFKARQAEDLKGVYQRVAAELHLLYSLAYDAKNAQKDGQFRRVSVKVNRDGSSARTRRGYYAR